MSDRTSDLSITAPVFQPSWGPGLAALWAVIIMASILPLAMTLAIAGFDWPTLADGTTNYDRLAEIGDPLAIVLCLIVASRLRSNPIDALALRFPKSAVRVLKIIGLIILAAAVALTMLGMLLGGDDDPNQQLNAHAVQGSNIFESLLAVGLLTPIKEEMIFRGILLLAFVNTRFWFWGAAVLTSALFAVSHNPTSINLLFHAPYFAMGLAFAAALRYSGSLWVPIGLHALKNCLAVLMISFG